MNNSDWNISQDKSEKMYSLDDISFLENEIKRKNLALASLEQKFNKKTNEIGVALQEIESKIINVATTGFIAGIIFSSIIWAIFVFII